MKAVWGTVKSYTLWKEGERCENGHLGILVFYTIGHNLFALLFGQHPVFNSETSKYLAKVVRLLYWSKPVDSGLDGIGNGNTIPQGSHLGSKVKTVFWKRSVKWLKGMKENSNWRWLWHFGLEGLAQYILTWETRNQNSVPSWLSGR